MSDNHVLLASVTTLSVCPSVHLSLHICHMINTRRDTVRTHRCPVGLVFSVFILLLNRGHLIANNDFNAIMRSVAIFIHRLLLAIQGMPRGELSIFITADCLIPYISPKYCILAIFFSQFISTARRSFGIASASGQESF